MQDVVVIGAGEVCRERYLPAFAYLYETGCLRLVAVVDSAPSDQLRRTLAVAPWGDTSVVEIASSSATDAIDAALSIKANDPFVVVATPTLSHVPIAVGLFERGAYAVIEKPYAANLDQVRAIDRYVTGDAATQVFFLGYYAIEKGLPALLLSPRAELRERAAAHIADREAASQVLSLREGLGQITGVSGVLLEGQGVAGSVDQRDWVLSNEAGGNTVETFYHLVCMLLAIAPDQRFRIASATAGIADEADARYREKHSVQAAETATTAVLLSDRLKAVLVCAKYVSPAIHERWMRIEYENGVARIDFESAQLSVTACEKTIDVGLPNHPKYVTQFLQAAEHYRNRQRDCMYPIFRSSLELTFQIRKAAYREQLRRYSAGGIGTTWLDDVFHGGGWRLKA